MVSGYPLQERERPRPHRLAVVRPAGHLRGIAGGVFGQNPAHKLTQVGGVELLVHDHRGRRARTLYSVDVPKATRVHGAALRMGHGLPRELHVFATDRLAVRPLEALAEVVGDALAVRRDAAVLTRGDLGC